MMRVSPKRGGALPISLAIVAALLVVPPLLLLIYGAVSNGSTPGAADSNLSLEGVSRVLGSYDFLTSLRNTIVLSVVVALGAVVIGTVLAWLVVKTDLKGRRLWENLLAIPLYVSPLFLGLAAIATFNRGGYVFGLLQGTPFQNAIDITSFGGIVAVLLVHYSSYVFLYMLGPLGSVDSQLEEAATVMGVSRARVLATVVLPLVAPAMLACGVMVFALTAEMFTVPALLGGTKIPVLATSIYYKLTYDPVHLNDAAFLAIILLIISSIGIVIYGRASRTASRYVVQGGKAHASKLTRLRGWSPVVLILLVLYLAVAVLLPFLALLLASLQYFVHGGTFDQIVRSITASNYVTAFTGANFQAIANSLILAVGSAAIICVLGLLISYVVRYGRARLRGLLEYAGTMTVAIPGMALAVGMIWTYARVPFVYGTLAILFIAYVTRFLSQGVRMIGSGLLPIGAELDEAAQVSGRGLVRRVWTIILPLTRRSTLSAFVVIFIFIINELPVTILLYTSSTQTVSTVIWSLTATGSSGVASVFALLLGIVTVILMGVLTAVSRGQTTISAASSG
jgi:iron(III) transport system permease protein